MFRNLLVVLALFSFAAQTFAADYCFPSQNPPGGKDPSEVKQYVSFIFDDNGYSGQNETMYEYKEGTIGWADRATVGGKDQNGPTQNPLNIQEGDMAVAWAREKLAGSRKNPDGSDVTLTFNVITGLFVPTWGASWQNRQSKFGGYSDPSKPYVKDVSGFQSIAVSWGREMKIGTQMNGDDIQPSYMDQGFMATVSAGHEIGNHTLDHMESNSPLPKEYFRQWDGIGGGYDPGTDTLPDGTVLDEMNEFGHPFNAYALNNGWIMYAGKQISKETWGGAIKLAEDQLQQYLGLNVASGKIAGFRAPRLEVNSNLFFALAEQGYLYDCGLEEGYETNIDGSNFLWPYTMDNGSWNVWTQKEWGEQVYIDSMPQGLWQYPVNVMIVPEDIRGDVWKNYKEVSSAEGHPLSAQDSVDWVAEGKVTGFDFNMFILWGMTGDNVLKTLKHTLDLRMDGNKAPMHVGGHTDYFTPIYDYATLLSDFNKYKYGLCVVNGWNTWEDRKACFESFADYAISKGAYIKSAKEVIEAIKEMQKDEVVGTEFAYYKPNSGEVSWIFQKNDKLNSSAETETFSNEIKNAKVKVDKASNGEYPYASYASYRTAGEFEGLDHIAVTYQSNAPLMLKIIVNNDKPWEVLLNNVGPKVESGKIPIEAFHYSQYEPGSNDEINTANITGFEIQPLTVGEQVENVNFSLLNMRLYGPEDMPFGKEVAVANNLKSLVSKVGLKSISATSLKLNIPNDGVFDIDLVGANGKVVQSVKKAKYAAGITNVKLNNLSNGVYMIKIKNKTSQKVMKAMIM